MLSETIAKIRDQDRKDAREDGRKEIISTLIKNGMPPKDLSKYLNISLSEIKLLSTSNVKIEDNIN